MLDNSSKEARCGVAAKRPRSVPVPDNLPKIGNIGQHAEAPEVLGRDIDFLAVDAQIDAAKETQVEACGGDDDVCVEFLAAVKLDAVRDDGFDGVGDDLGAPGGEALEEVAVRTQAETLLPGVVGRLKMRVQGDVWGELFARLAADEVGGARGEIGAEVVQEGCTDNVLEAWGSG